MWAEAQEQIVKLKRSLVKAQEKNVRRLAVLAVAVAPGHCVLVLQLCMLPVASQPQRVPTHLRALAPTCPPRPAHPHCPRSSSPTA